MIIFPTGPTCAYLPSAVVNVNLAPWRRTLISATPLQHMHRNTAEADSLRILHLRACQTRKLAIHEVHKLTSNYRMSAHRQSIRPPPFCSSMARADYPRVPKTRSHMPASAMQGRPHALPSKSSDFAQFDMITITIRPSDALQLLPRTISQTDPAAGVPRRGRPPPQ